MNFFQRWLVARKLKNNFYEMSAADLRHHQNKAANKLWDFVRNNSAYYKNAYPFPVPLSQVAPCSRTMMMAHFNDINTANLDRDTLVKFRIEKEKTGKMQYLDGGYSIGLSSGTTGSRLLTVLSKNERDLYSCLLWARNGMPDSVKTHRVLFALRTYNPTFTEVSAFGIKMVYVDYTHPVETLIGIINKNRLNILAGPPSLLLLIARESQKIDHPIDAVVSYAEVLDDAAKNKLESTFQAPVVQIYQGAEGFIGTTCRAGSLHFNEDVLLIETVQEPGDGPVRVLITDLYRRTQPIIRYQLDDLLEISSKPCSCGSSFRVIKKIHGRSDD
ncbi:hypothetical protein ACFLZW_07920, partial [Chloroflexota bacterium]